MVSRILTLEAERGTIFTCRARPLLRCCSPDKKWRGDSGMLHGLSVVVAVRLYADQSGQLFSKTLVYTFFFL